MKSKIFIVIPAYNAEKTLSRVIKSIKKEGYNNIVVVDDGSKDKTYEIALKEGVYVLRHIVNRGQGAALRTGDRFAIEKGADIIVHFDADGQMLAEDIKEVIKPLLDEKVIIVFGSRYLSKKPKNIPTSKKIIHWLARIFMKLFYGVEYTDPQSGFRAFKSEFKNKISITFDRMEHCSEILYKTHKNRIPYKEVPVKIIYTKESNESSAHGSFPLLSGIKIAFNLLFKRRRTK